MDVSILFNWPLGQESARVSFTTPTIEDLSSEFRVGIIKRGEGDRIFWLKQGWINCESLHNVKFDVHRGEIIVVDRRKNGTATVLTRNTWDTEKEWPPEARGGSSVHVPWSFH